MKRYVKNIPRAPHATRKEHLKKDKWYVTNHSLGNNYLFHVSKDGDRRCSEYYLETSSIYSRTASSFISSVYEVDEKDVYEFIHGKPYVTEQTNQYNYELY